MLHGSLFSRFKSLILRFSGAVIFSLELLLSYLGLMVVSIWNELVLSVFLIPALHNLYYFTDF